MGPSLLSALDVFMLSPVCLSVTPDCSLPGASVHGISHLCSLPVGNRKGTATVNKSLAAPPKIKQRASRHMKNAQHDQSSEKHQSKPQ